MAHKSDSRVVALDSIAWKILEALQHNARLSFAELGRMAGLSTPAAAERVGGLCVGVRECRRDMAEIIPPPLRRVSVPRGQRNDAPKIQAGVVLISEADRPVKLDRLLDDLQRAIGRSGADRGTCRRAVRAVDASRRLDQERLRGGQGDVERCRAMLQGLE